MGISADRPRNAVWTPLGEPITLKVGNRLPSLTANLFDPLGNPAGIGTGTLTFRMREIFTRIPKIVAGPVTIQDQATASVRYDWQVGDSDTAAEFEAWFDHDDGTGRVESFPSQGALHVRVEP